MNAKSGIVFRPVDEKISFYLTLFTAAMIATEMLYFTSIRSYRGVLYYIFGLLTLQALHVVLTYIGLLFIPEFRTWVAVKSHGHPLRFWGRILLMASSLFLVFCYATNFAYHSSLAPRHFVALMTLLIAVITLHHRMSQTYGISSAYLYSQASHLRARNSMYAKIERISFLTLFFSVGSMFCFRLPLLHIFLQHFGWNLTPSVAGRLAVISSSVAFAATSSLIVTSLVDWRSNREIGYRLRTAHVLRFSFFPLSFFSLSAFWAMEGLHGLEYIFIWRKMSSKIQLGTVFHRYNLMGAGLIVLSYYFIAYVNRDFHFLSSATRTDLWMRMAFALNTAVTFTHFYLDRQIFRMRDVATRSIIGPLLVSAPAAGRGLHRVPPLREILTAVSDFRSTVRSTDPIARELV